MVYKKSFILTFYNEIPEQLPTREDIKIMSSNPVYIEDSNSMEIELVE